MRNSLPKQLHAALPLAQDVQTDPEATARLRLRAQRRDAAFLGGGGAAAATDGCKRGVADGNRGFEICDDQQGEGGRGGRQADPPLLREVEAAVRRRAAEPILLWLSLSALAISSGASFATEPDVDSAMTRAVLLPAARAARAEETAARAAAAMFPERSRQLA